MTLHDPRTEPEYYDDIKPREGGSTGTVTVLGVGDGQKHASGGGVGPLNLSDKKSPPDGGGDDRSTPWPHARR